MESELEDWEPMRDRRTESAKKGIHNLTQVFLCYVSFYNKRWHCIRIGGLHQRIASPHGTAHGTWPHGRHTGHVPLPQTLLVFPPAGSTGTERDMNTRQCLIWSMVTFIFTLITVTNIGYLPMTFIQISIKSWFEDH